MIGCFMHDRIIIASILVLCMIIASMLVREKFYIGGSDSSIVYTSHLPNATLWLQRIGENWEQKHVGADGMDVIRDSLMKSRVPAPILLNGRKSMMVCLDPYVYETKWKSLELPLIASAPEGYFAAISSLTSAFTTECSYNLYGKRIGYATDSEWFLIHAILYSYHIPKKAVELVHVSAEDVLQLDKLLDKTIDVFITYIVPNSLYYAMLRLLPVSLMGWQNIDLERLRVFHPYLQKRVDVDVKQLFASPSPRSQLVVMDREKDSALLSLSLKVYLVHGPRPSIKESFITRLEMSEELTDPAYQCYGDLTIAQQALCNSKYDVSGLPKNSDQQTVWDRPCFEDKECPYYKANKNYGNTRGGCVRGKCEFPVGVKRSSYRHFVSDLPYVPLCYQCKDIEDPDCCEKQKDRKLYPKLKSPDYAFADDTAARMKAKLPYFVSIV